MTTEHVPADDLALYVMGELPPARSAKMEAHVVLCPACAAALGREAKLEIALYEIGASLDAEQGKRGRSAHPRAPAARRVRPGPAILALTVSLALAAGYLLWISRPSRGLAARAADRPSLVACPPGQSEVAERCRAWARRTGLYVQDPPGAAIPRYETLAPPVHLGGTKPAPTVPGATAPRQ